MRFCYVFDVDGVLLDNAHRLKYIQGEKDERDWSTYFSLMEYDTPIGSNVRLARELGGMHALVAVTGRPERFHTKTAVALHDAGVRVERLICRSDSDRRPNHEYKQGVARNLIAEGWDIRLWVDDNPRVATVLREEVGVPVAVVAGVGQFMTEGL